MDVSSEIDPELERIIKGRPLPTMGARLKALCVLWKFKAKEVERKCRISKRRLENLWNDRVIPTDGELRAIADLCLASLSWIQTCRGDPLKPGLRLPPKQAARRIRSRLRAEQDHYFPDEERPVSMHVGKREGWS